MPYSQSRAPRNRSILRDLIMKFPPFRVFRLLYSAPTQVLKASLHVSRFNWAGEVWSLLLLASPVALTLITRVPCFP